MAALRRSEPWYADNFKLSTQADEEYPGLLGGTKFAIGIPCTGLNVLIFRFVRHRVGIFLYSFGDPSPRPDPQRAGR